MSATTPLHAEARAVPSWTLGDRLGKALDYADISVQSMADLLGIGRNTVGNYIAGRTQPSRATVLTWSMFTGVDPGWLEHGTAGASSPDGTPTLGSPPGACYADRAAEVIPLRHAA